MKKSYGKFTNYHNLYVVKKNIQEKGRSLAFQTLLWPFSI